jgi:hypothetical protein
MIRLVFLYLPGLLWVIAGVSLAIVSWPIAAKIACAGVVGIILGAYQPRTAKSLLREQKDRRISNSIAMLLSSIVVLLVLLADRAVSSMISTAPYEAPASKVVWLAVLSWFYTAGRRLGIQIIVD